MKKTFYTLCFFIAVAFTLALIATAETYSGTCGDDLTWILDDNGLLTISGTGKMSYYSNYTEVPWFSHCSSVKKAKIGDGVKNISNHAFEYCTALESIDIGDGVAIVGTYAFSDCSALKSIKIGESLTQIGKEAFYECTALKEVHISNVEAWCKVNFWGSSANPLFYAHNLYLNGELLTNLVISDSVISIGSYAFNFCTSIESVNIGKDVTVIGSTAFYGCTALKEVYISDIVAWCKIDFIDPSSNPLYYAGSLYLNGELVTSLLIPNEVTSIGGNAFYGCTSITEISIPNSVTLIYEYVFGNCTSLTKIEILDVANYMHISKAAFYGCTALEEVHVSDIVTWCKISFDNGYANPLYYAGNLYLNKNNVTEFFIPESVTSIDDYAFFWL